MKRPIIALLLSSLCLAASAADDLPAYPRVKLDTTEGVIVLELDARRAPITVQNFVQLVDSGYYDGTTFHRVIPDFMVQGGGYTRDLELKEPKGTIVNESGNGLQNLRGTVAMARLAEPHSAMAQFFINLADNRPLDPKPDSWGYAVFGYVIEGMDVIEGIAKIPTGPGGQFRQDVPVVPVVITRATRVKD